MEVDGEEVQVFDFADAAAAKRRLHAYHRLARQ